MALVREVRRRGRWTRPGRAEPRAPRLAASLLPILPILGLLGLAPAAPTASATPVPAGSGTPITGDYAGAGASLHYIGYVPSSWGPGKSLPLVVALHGCTESADQFRQLTGFDQLAEQRGFIVVYPEQTQAANYLLCWNWFRSTDQARGSGEPALIAGLTNSVAQRYGVDRSRIYVTGLSAGGAMSAVMGATFPDLYAAVGIGSGCQYGGGVGCLSGNATDPTVTGQLAHAAMDVRARTLPAVVFQGDADTTVPAANAAQLVRQWQVSADWADDGAVNGSVPAAPSAVVQGQVPGGRAYTVNTYTDGRGGELEQLWLVHGMVHAWSGGCACESYADPLGPNESQAMYDFFMRHPMPAAAASGGGAPDSIEPPAAPDAGPVPGTGPAGTPSAPSAQPGAPSSSAGAGVPMRVGKLIAGPRVSLGQARRSGIRVSFVVPRGARVIQVQLLRGGRSLVSRIVPAARSGSRQTVQLRGVRLSRQLRGGKYSVALRAGGTRALLDPPVRRTITVS